MFALLETGKHKLGWAGPHSRLPSLQFKIYDLEILINKEILCSDKNIFREIKTKVKRDQLRVKTFWKRNSPLFQHPLVPLESLNL